MTHQNIEFKAKCENIEGFRNYLINKKARFVGKDIQIDTYFKVKNGRLKLREGRIENYLIFYKRQNKKIRKSSVTLVDSQKYPELKKILINTIDTQIVVKKVREIYFIGNIKFHLDLVEGLGTFLEIEAKNAHSSLSEKQLHKQCSYFLRKFDFNKNDLITESYSDLLLKTKKNPLALRQQFSIKVFGGLFKNIFCNKFYIKNDKSSSGSILNIRRSGAFGFSFKVE